MSEELQPGEVIGNYRLEVRLGGGGFGSVWKAVQTDSGRVVALKVLRTDVYSTDTTKLRSEVELLAATASSRSPHVVRVLSGGVEPQPYVVMEFIDGVDLGKELDRRKRIPQLEVIRIGVAVANALAALQAVGIIHRDIKPANVMVDVDGVIKLTDFGIAKIVGFDTITATSQMPMSMAYAAPEVWEGSASHRSDLYSLGILLFQCLAGRPPFTGSYAQVYRQHASKDPDWTLLPEGTVQALRDLLRDCLAKAEDDRPQHASAVVERLAGAERELNARVQNHSDEDIPAHEPQAFGPWLRRDKHPTQPWAFLCIHETTSEKATVEVHFADDIEYGTRLRKAVEVNPKLVPLGAERLLGTNRLVLRPGEAWVSPPSGQFQFWVAREELSLRPAPATVDDSTLHAVAAGLAAVREAAATSGIDLTLPPESLHLMPDGTVLVRRPGLASAGDDGMAWLKQLRLDGQARTSVVNARDVREIVAHHGERAGVARAGAERASQGDGEDGGVTSVPFAELGTRVLRPSPLGLATEPVAKSSPVAGRLEDKTPLAIVSPGTTSNPEGPAPSPQRRQETAASDPRLTLAEGVIPPRLDAPAPWALGLLLLLSGLWLPAAFVAMEELGHAFFWAGTGALWGGLWGLALGAWVRRRGSDCSNRRAVALGLTAGALSYLLPYIVSIVSSISEWGILWIAWLSALLAAAVLSLAVPRTRRARWSCIVTPAAAIALWLGFFAYAYSEAYLFSNFGETFHRAYIFSDANTLREIVAQFIGGGVAIAIVVAAMRVVLRGADSDDRGSGSGPSQLGRAPLHTPHDQNSNYWSNLP